MQLSALMSIDGALTPYTYDAASQSDPGLAFFLGEPLESPGRSGAASKGDQKKPASAGATDLLGLTMEEELTEEEELVSHLTVP